MLTLDEAVQHALDGDAILFLGAGFSQGLQNSSLQALPTAREFALELAAAAESPGIDDLDIASQEFLRKFSDYHLAELVRDRFRVASTTSIQDEIADIPWIRVYTTNYDNAFEIACKRIKKTVRPVTTNEHLADLPRNQLWCVHINGFIDRLTNSYIDSQLRLTNASYLTTSFADSFWATQFRQDIDVARTLIVVGYSLYDLDISRLLFLSKKVVDKSVFVTKPNPHPALQARLRPMGNLLSIGVDQFSKEIDRVRSTYTPRDRPPLFSCLTSLNPTASDTAERFRDDDVFTLLLQGMCSLPILRTQTASGGSPPYI